MATIIKNGAFLQSSADAPRGVAYDLSDFNGQADQYLKEVRREAARIVQEAKQESEQIRKQAEEAGRQAAQQAIEQILDQKVGQQMKTLTPALAAAVRQIEDSRQDWLRYWETAAVKLACAIAARIIRREIRQDDQIPVPWIQEALEMCAGAAEITVRLSATDFETLRGEVEQLCKVFHPAAATTLVADESVSPGGCRIETEFGSIDQQIETQLQRIEQELG